MSEAFHGVVSFEWPAYLSGSEAIGGFLTYDLTKNSLLQIVVAVFVFAGCCIYFVEKRKRWVVVSLLAPVVILASASSAAGTLKHLLAGVWYPDTFRIAAMVVMVSVPLAAIGMNGVLSCVGRFALALGWGEKRKKHQFCVQLSQLFCAFSCRTLSLSRLLLVTCGSS